MKKNSLEFEEKIDNNLFFNMRNISIPGIHDNKWKEVLDQQEYDLMIFEIRDELITRVLDECYKKYIENESIKYVVNCTYLAWKEIVDLNFFVHDCITDFYEKKSLWNPDTESEPCIPDSWANGNISLKHCYKPKIADQKIVKTLLSDYQIIDCPVYPSENKFNVQPEALKSDNLIAISDSESCTRQESETERSKFSVQFTSFVSPNEISEEKILESIKEKASEDFTMNNIKSASTTKKKITSMTTVVSAGKIATKKKPPLTWYEMDQQVESPQLLTLPLLRESFGNIANVDASIFCNYNGTSVSKIRVRPILRDGFVQICRPDSGGVYITIIYRLSYFI